MGEEGGGNVKGRVDGGDAEGGGGLMAALCAVADVEVEGGRGGEGEGD